MPLKMSRSNDYGRPFLFNPSASHANKQTKSAAYLNRSASCLSSASALGGSAAPSFNNSNEVRCVCGSRLTICRGCRSLPKAPAARRGGTLGFRPPEVMLRCVTQTTAIDLWAVGVIFLSFLTGRYPFIKIDDDLEVLHAFTHLLSYERMQRGAYSVGKRLLIDPKPKPLDEKETPLAFMKKRLLAIRKGERKLVAPPPLLAPQSTPGGNSQISPASSMIALSSTHHFPGVAYDLCARLLEPSPSRRITATEAIQHPFIKGGAQPKHPIPSSLSS